MSDGLQVEAIFLTRAGAPGTYAVLARVSPGYPPLLGRSSTCYSPVRRSTRGRSRFRARLACVRHAASVHSEPGSNSPVWILYRTEPAKGSEADYLKLVVACQKASGILTLALPLFSFQRTDCLKPPNPVKRGGSGILYNRVSRVNSPAGLSRLDPNTACCCLREPWSSSRDAAEPAGFTSPFRPTWTAPGRRRIGKSLLFCQPPAAGISKRTLPSSTRHLRVNNLRSASA